MKKLKLALVFAAVVLAPAEGRTERMAALPGSGEDSLQVLIKFPELKGDTTATIRCAARVEDNGKMKDNGCASTSSTMGCTPIRCIFMASIAP